MTRSQAPARPVGFTGRDFRDVLAGFATGVNVITTRGEDHSYGMTASAFSSVSLDPPLILVCIGNTATEARWSAATEYSPSTS